MAFWLMKSEPESYSWEDLQRDGETEWDGVRNFAARLHLRAMKPGDKGLFYHSGDVKAVVGIMEVTTDPHPDPKDADWTAVRVKPVKAVDPVVTLKAMKAEPKLGEMVMIRQSRLSVSPVTDAEWKAVLALSR
jgi:predicted RNA-binding protein with PUA-like domain